MLESFSRSEVVNPGKLFWAMVLILALALVFPAVALAASSSPSVEPDAPAMIEPAKLQEDLDFLFATIEQTHPNMYAYVDRTEFEGRTGALRASLNRSMTAGDFYRLVAPAVAGLKSGHTKVLPPGTIEYFKALAIGEKLFTLKLDCTGRYPTITQDDSSSLPIGATLLSINGTDAANLIDKYASSIGVEGKASCRSILSSYLLIFLWADFGVHEPLSLEIRTKDGKVGQYSLEPLTKSEIETLRGSGKSLQDFSFRYIEELDVGVIDWRSFGGGREEFVAFLQKTFTALKQREARALVIDLRNNGGGSSLYGRDMMGYLYDQPYREFERMSVRISPLLRQQQSSLISALKAYLNGREPKDGELVDVSTGLLTPPKNPLRFKGEVYVLIGSRTASSAMNFASMAKHYVAATLVGVETVDTMSLYGDSIHFQLPHSGLTASSACKYFVNPGGREDLRGVIPDHEVSQTYEEVGTDNVMDYILGLVESDHVREDIQIEQ